jgi:hypothetical protein
MFKKYSKCILIVFIILVVLNMGIAGCNETMYSFHSFSYPPNSIPHGDNWEYIGKVTISSKEKGPLTQKSEKNVKITVVDKNKNTYLYDELKFLSAYIELSIIWHDFEKIQINLFEVGNEFSTDNYNQKLIKRGPNRLGSLKYTYDFEIKKFKRAEYND